MIPEACRTTPNSDIAGLQQYSNRFIVTMKPAEEK